MAVLEAGQRQRQPGQRRHRAQHLEQRIEAAHGPVRLADQHAQGDAGDHRQQVADRDPFEAGQQLPGQADVVAAVVVEGVDDQLPGLGDHLRRWRQRGVGAGAEHLPDHTQHQQDHQGRQQLPHDALSATPGDAGEPGGLGDRQRLGGGGLEFHIGIHGRFLAERAVFRPWP